jgi:FkbM family methyltransferase
MKLCWTDLSRTRALAWHTVYPSVIGQKSIVVDLGAHRGRFAERIVEAFDCTCHAVEASPHLIPELKKSERLRVHHYAIAPADGELWFNIANRADSSSLLDLPPDKQLERVRVPAITLGGFLSRHGVERVDVLKIDIEGAEIGVLDSVSDEILSKIGQITIEFHDFCGVTPSAEVRRVVGRLQKLGFFYIRFSGQGNQDTLLINRRIHRLSLVECYYIKYIVRNLRGLARVIRRKLGIPQ